VTNLFVLAAIAALVAAGVWLVRMRRALHDCRTAFDALTTKAPVGILVADEAGLCTFANDVWYELSGLDPGGALGHSWSQAIHPDDVPMVMQRWEESVRQGVAYLNEVRLVRPDGSIRSVLASAAPITDAVGRVSGFIGTVLDISGRRDAERRVREQTTLLQSFIDHAPAAIYVKDAAGRYLLINRRHADLWPAMRDGSVGTTPHDWFPADVADSFLESDRRVLESGEARTFEESLPHADGPHSYVTVKFPVLDEAGRAVAVAGVSTDVTELERARRALAARERLLRNLIDVQEREKQMLCHEFHDGLIQYAVGSKMMLESLKHTPLDDTTRPVVESVIDYLAKGIEDGRRVIRGIRPAALDDLGLQAAISDLCEEVRSGGVDVESALDPSIDTLATPLQTTIYRIVQESLANVRKHSGAERATVRIVRRDGTVVVAVEDTGRGFASVHLDPAQAPDVEGGLGLLGMRERVRLAGGTCVIDSEPGGGTRIRATLPIETHVTDAVAAC
jgi:PAS domain S-box-containing protein